MSISSGVTSALAEQRRRKQADREALKQRAIALIKQGATRAELVERLGVSPGYYSRLAAELRAARTPKPLP